jgi:hypothetical protein
MLKQSKVMEMMSNDEHLRDYLIYGDPVYQVLCLICALIFKALNLQNRKAISIKE